MEEPRRKQSIRLPEYDYATTGSYFVTICVEGKRVLFGAVRDGEVELTEAGLMVESWWGNIERRFPSVLTGAYVVMPNHFHGIVHLGAVAEPSTASNETGGHGGPPLRIPSRSVKEALSYDDSVGAARRGRPAADRDAVFSKPPTLSDVIGWFKSATTCDYGIGVRDFGWPKYDRRLWQRGFYDHIVRNSTDLARIEKYIADNPARWTMDELFRE